jgi:large subunit ribosomal protein L15
MKLNSLAVSSGANKKPKRVGRGAGSGLGKTCGRGVKGQKSRSGVAINGFEGGQMSIYRRLPKRGFVNSLALKTMALKLDILQKAISSGKLLYTDNVIGLADLKNAKIVSNYINNVKIIYSEGFSSKINFNGLSFSTAARKAIENLGGVVS